MLTTKQKQTKLNLQMREILGNAYSFVRGRQYTASIANITYEELLDAAIHQIEGTEGRSDVRVPILDRIRKIKEEISQAVTTVKSIEPERWALDSDDFISADEAMNTSE